MFPRLLFPTFLSREPRRTRRGATPAALRPIKKLKARALPEYSQTWRLVFQLGFLLLNLWIGARFYLFVRYYESGGTTVFVPRPPGVEGWLPIAALMNLKFAIETWTIPPVHAAGFFLLVSFLAMSIVMRKSFCSWLCPIGTISEWLWKGGEALFGRNFALPRWLDIPLRSLKYLLFGFFAYAIVKMSAEAVLAFLTSPYGVIADVKMLDFFRRMGTTSAIFIGVTLLLSVPLRNPWCRYLCPYGALMGLVALVSPTRIRRDGDACIDCAKCAKACPSLLPVDRLVTVKSAECTACLICVASCPAKGALQFVAPRRQPIPAWAVATAVFVVFVGIVGVGRATGHWHAHVPDALYFDLIPRASEFGHP